MSGIAFVLMAVVVGIRKKSTVADVRERRIGRKLDLAKTEKSPVSKKAPVRKAA